MEEDPEFFEDVNSPFDLLPGYNIREKLSEKKKQFSEKKNQIKTKMSTTPMVKLRDKLAFVFGVSNLWVTAYILGSRPDEEPYWYTISALVLLTFRFFDYRSQKYHYFMFDFCYYTNLLCMLYLWVFPHSRELFMICFVLSNGPLCWAVVAWRNSMVFHSVDKSTVPWLLTLLCVYLVRYYRVVILPFSSFVCVVV